MLPPTRQYGYSLIRHVRRPIFYGQQQRNSIASDYSQQFANSATSTNRSIAYSFSRHYYRNYRNDYFSTVSAFSSTNFRATSEAYLPSSSSYHDLFRQRYHASYGRRMFSSTAALHFAEKDEARSKVERTLALLKDELESRERERKEIQAFKDAAAVLKKKSLWSRVLDECKHYYHGFKLLFLDFRVSARLVMQLLRGHTLSRKERRQLIRSVSDLFRLVPFLIFVIVPFMEFTLPIFLKLFPNMLPSTFQEASKESEKIRKQLKVKLEMAKFMQATMEELALERKQLKEGESRVQDFTEFLKKIREEGGSVTNEELLKFSKLFEDELTLDNLSHAQLRALCRIVGLTPIGTSNMLRFQLNMKLRELKADDKLIAKEGLDSLSVMELQQACRARGMRSVGVSEQRLKSQLSQWLELSLNEKVPPSLLLLSSTLYLPEEFSFSDRLTTLLKTLPVPLADEVKVKLAELEGTKVDNKTRLELVQTIEAALKNEREEEERSQKLEAEKILNKLASAPAEERKHVVDVDELVDKAPIIKDVATAAKAKKEIDVNTLESIEELLSDAARGKLSEEKEDLQELKRDVQEHKEDVSEVQALMVQKGEKVRESKAAKRLQSRVDGLISRADKLIDKLREEKQQLTEEMKEKEEKDAAKKDIIFINDMLLSLRKLQKLPDDTKLERVVDVLKALDEDHDGAIDVNLALRVIDVLGQENVKLSHDQMQRICALLKKETIVDEMEQLQQQQQLFQSSPQAPQPQQQQHAGDHGDVFPSPTSSDTSVTGSEQDNVDKRKERVAQ